MRRVRLLVLSGLFLLDLGLVPAVLAADGPAPGDNCVPGTVWEDRTSGVKYICVYDELYGGPRWVLMRTGQTGSSAWLYRSSSQGCLFGVVSLSALGGSGADVMARSYRWPCGTTYDRTSQPAGELRTRLVIQRYSSSGWGTCRDSGFRYSTAPAAGWLTGIDMGSSPDCGYGPYRAIGYGAMFQGLAWRGSSLYSPSMSLP